MLVLTRKTGESIQIDENISVTVSQVRGGRVRLSIDAPRDVRVVRKEVLERDFGTEPETVVIELPVTESGDCILN